MTITIRITSQQKIILRKEKISKKICEIAIPIKKKIFSTIVKKKETTLNYNS